MTKKESSEIDGFDFVIHRVQRRNLAYIVTYLQSVSHWIIALGKVVYINKTIIYIIEIV